MKEKISGVYAIQEVGSDIVLYIGYSSHIAERIKKHVRYFKGGGRANKSIQALWPFDLTYAVLLECEGEEMARQEALLINEYKAKGEAICNSTIPHIEPPVMGESETKRFLSKFEKKGPNECWPSTGPTRSSGYCRIVFNHVTYDMHRIAYYVGTGEWPLGLMIRHKCDNKLCCNPEHLETGTAQDNSKDYHRKNSKGAQSLKREKVREIVRLGKEGCSNRTIADKLNLSKSCIDRVFYGETKHIAPRDRSTY